MPALSRKFPVHYVNLARAKRRQAEPASFPWFSLDRDLPTFFYFLGLILYQNSVGMAKLEAQRKKKTLLLLLLTTAIVEVGEHPLPLLLLLLFPQGLLPPKAAAKEEEQGKNFIFHPSAQTRIELGAQFVRIISSSMKEEKVLFGLENRY